MAVKDYIIEVPLERDGDVIFVRCGIFPEFLALVAPFIKHKFILVVMKACMAAHTRRESI